MTRMSRRERPLARTLAAAAATLAAMALSVIGRPAAAQVPTAAPPPSPSTCVAHPAKEPWPPIVGLGATADVTLTVSFSGCPGYKGPLHIVLVLDASGSMAGEGHDQLRKAAVRLIDELNMTDNPVTEVGVVMFNSSAKVLCQLTNRASQATGCVGRVGAAGATCIDCGVKAGLGVMDRGRSDAPDRGTIREVMVVVSDGANDAGCGPLISAAGQAKGQGIEVFTICIGRSCSSPCMRAAATAPAYHFRGDAAGLLAAFQRIGAELAVLPLRQVVVTDTLGADMLPIAGAVSAPGVPSPDGRSVEWRLADVPTLATELGVKVRVPAVAGTYPTNASAVGTFVDGLGAIGSFTFPVPTIRVDPNPPPTGPTRTAIPPTPTPAPPDMNVCPRLTARLPRAAIDAALADPTRIGGWGVPCRVGQPVGPMNPLRRWLDLRNANQPWHPLFNGVVFKCGCG